MIARTPNRLSIMDLLVHDRNLTAWHADAIAYLMMTKQFQALHKPQIPRNENIKLALSAMMHNAIDEFEKAHEKQELFALAKALVVLLRSATQYAAAYGLPISALMQEMQDAMLEPDVGMKSWQPPRFDEIIHTATKRGRNEWFKIPNSDAS